MLAFAALCFSLLFSAVLGIPLAQRDVFNPTITNPHDGTVWTVGAKEQVTWETDNIPPDSQLTNPTGQVILGFMENDSLNLQLENPLAKGFNIRDGKVTVTVPDVPPRDDYIIVLMGDSGNASPAFAITSISGGSSSSSRPSSTETPPKPSTSSTASSDVPPATSASPAPSPTTSVNSPPPSSTVVNNSPPLTGSVVTGGISTTSESSLAPEATSITGVASNLLSSTSSTSSVTQATAAASSNAAWSHYNTKLWSVIAAPLVLCLLI